MTEPTTAAGPTDEERTEFKRGELEAAKAIMAGDRYCPDPSVHEARQQDDSALEERNDFKVGFHRGLRVGYLRGKKDAALPPSTPPALDVKRLALAMSNQREYIKGRPSAWNADDFEWVARQVAAEYARLQEQDR